jgi:outer membrane protein assembly factor BamD (BamD/ComL family)
MLSLPATARATVPVRHAVACCVALAVLTGCKGPVARGDPQVLLAAGKEAYGKKDYREAIRNFRGVTAHSPESDEAEEAHFLLAESRRLRGSGATAYDSYGTFAERYPNSRFSVGAAEGEYRLGLDFLDGKVGNFLFFPGDRGYGVRVLEHMQARYRNHSLADDALVRVAVRQIDRREYEDAAFTLRRLLAVYPRREHVLWARFELAHTLWLLSDGPDYERGNRRGEPFPRCRPAGPTPHRLPSEPRARAP